MSRVFPAGLLFSALLGSAHFGPNLAAKSLVESTFIAGSGDYTVPSNWSPAGVPNNSASTSYNITIPAKADVRLASDTNISVSKLKLDGFFAVSERDFATSATTMTPVQWSPSISVLSSPQHSASFNAGTLSTFSQKILHGSYSIYSYVMPATFEFSAANIFELQDASLFVSGRQARIVDESGNDAFRNLRELRDGSILSLFDHDVNTSAAFRNDGMLDLYASGDSSVFTSTGSLANFDKTSRTITGGRFSLRSDGSFPAEVRFPGADIANIESEIEIYGALARVTDSTGLDGLRNLKRILAGGSLTMNDHPFTTLGDFSNEGLLRVDRAAFTIAGSLTNFDATMRTLNGGKFVLISQGTLTFNGADIVHNASSITLIGGSFTDLTGRDGLRNFTKNLASGAFAVGNNTTVTAAEGADFTNAGSVSTAAPSYNIHEFLDPGIFVVPSGAHYTQTGGQTANSGTLQADVTEIAGGVLSGGGSITGDVIVTGGTATLGSGAKIAGALTLGPKSHFGYNFTRYYGGDPLEVSGKVSVAGTLDIEIADEVFLSSDAVLTLLRSDTALSGHFSNAPAGARIRTVDGQSSFVVSYQAQEITLTNFHAEPRPAQLLNISSRTFLQSAADDAFGDRAVVIDGFIVSGNLPKKVMVRGIGPSLSKRGLSPTLTDPVLELHDANGVIATNDDWQETQADAIAASGIAPEDSREGAIIAVLPPGSYSVVLKEKNGSAGYGLVEVYDLPRSGRSKLANISGRGFVDASNFLIAGIITGEGKANAELVIRAIGPQLRRDGIFNAVTDPVLDVRDGDGSLVSTNDDWYSNYAEIPAELHPANDAESAIRISLPQGSYTAIVRSKGDDAGVALVEVYDLRR